MSDWELLQAFVKNRSETAFAELVQRHLNWVYSTARRQVRDPHLAEDIAQAVFVLLARKADKLRHGTILSGWLFRTTRYVASCAMRTEYRRKTREQAAVVMSPTTSSADNETLWNQLTPHLDQAVASLSQADRTAILLRFYEKKPLREVGERLGLSEDAAKKRVSRAVEKLRDLITRRGVVLGGTALAVALAEQAVQGAPVTLANTVLKASASTTIPQLARETLNAWHWAKLKLVTSVVAMSVAGGFFVVHMTSRHEPRATSLPPANTIVAAQPGITTEGGQTASTSAGNPTAQPLVAARRVITIHVVEAQTKQPISGVEFDIFGLDRDGINGHTDKDGSYQIQLPQQDPEFLEVIARKTGFVSMVVFWHTRAGTFHLPQDFTFKLEPSTSIGGIVQDEQGQPIAGVSVSISRPWSNMGGATEEVYPHITDNVVTDANGRWRSDHVPADLSRLEINLKHPEYCTGTAHPLPEKLRDMTAVLAMKKGLVLQGVVLGDNGQPIEGATVKQGPMCCSPSNPPMKTDAAGRFRFTNITPGPLILTFQAEGHAPELTTVDVNSQTAPLEIHLAKGGVIRGRVVDKEGNSISGAWVMSDTWHEHRSLGWRSQTDAEGRFVWSNAPPDEVQFAIGKEGFMYINTPSSMPHLKPSEQEQVITLLPMLRVRGTAVDADTGESIRNLTVIPGSTTMETNRVSWNEYGIITSTNGQYEIAFDDQPSGGHIDTNGHEIAYNSAHIIRMEADGYDPVNSRPFKPDEDDVVSDFHLRKGTFVSGVVRAVDGTSLENAEVILGTRSTNNMIDERKMRTDVDGKFRLLKSGENYSLTVTHERGFAYLTREQFQTAAAIIVQPWGRIEGTLRIGRHPGTNQTIVAVTATSGYQTKAQTDDQGSFVMDKVPPLLLWLRRQSTGKLGESWLYRSDLGSADVHAGETVHLVLGGSGRAVVGHVLAPEGYGKPIDWRYSRVNLSFFTTSPEHFATMTDAEKLAWRQAWFKSLEGQAYVRNPSGHSAMINDDATFRLDDVAPGTYRFNISVNAPPENPYTINGTRIGEETRTITVPDGDPDKPIDLGEIELMPIVPQN